VPMLPGRAVPQHPHPPLPLGYDRGGMGGLRAVAAGSGVAGRARRPPGQLVHARDRLVPGIVQQRDDPLPVPASGAPDTRDQHEPAGTAD
jgi:hypothetical protein